MHSVLKLLAAAAALVAAAGSSTFDLPVRQAVLLHRHGDRSLLRCLPASQGCGAFWSEGYGMLTSIGLSQLHTLGTALRTRYVQGQGLIPGNWSRSSIVTRSTHVDRTLQSATALLQGLYPPGTGQSAGGRGLPGAASAAPIYTQAKAGDTLLRGAEVDTCPGITTLNDQVASDYQGQLLAEEAAAAPTLAALGPAVGITPLTWEAAGTVADSLTCMAAHGRAWPRGVTEGDWNTTAHIYQWQVWQRYRSSHQRQAAAGLLIGDIATRLTARALNESQPGWDADAAYADPTGNAVLGPPLTLYSAHDTTVYSLMYGLGVWTSPHPNPPYASSVVVELVALPQAIPGSTAHWAVRVWFNSGIGTEDSGGAGTPPPFHTSNVIPTPGCEGEDVGMGGDSLCPLDTWLRLAGPRSITPSAYSTLCGLDTPPVPARGGNPGFVEVAGPLLGFALGAAVVGGVWYIKRRQQGAAAAPQSREEGEGLL